MGIQQALFMVGTSVVPSGSGTWDVVATANPPGTLAADITFGSDGNVSYTSGSSGPSFWVTPQSGGVGAGYWLRGTQTASNGLGTMTAPTGWNSLSTNRTFSLSFTSSGANEANRTFTFEIATDAAGTNVIATYTNVTFFVIFLD